MAPLPIVGDIVVPPPSQPPTTTTSTTYSTSGIAAIGTVIGVLFLFGILICCIRAARRSASSRPQLQPYRGKADPIAATNATADHWLTPTPKPTRAKPEHYAMTAYSGTSADESGVAEPPPAYTAEANGGGAAAGNATSGET